MGTDETEDLRSTAENLVADAEHLKQIETLKLQLDPEQSETHELAVESEQLAERIAAEARAERDLVEQLAEDDAPS